MRGKLAPIAEHPRRSARCDDVDDARDPEAEIEARLRLLGAVILALGIILGIVVVLPRISASRGPRAVPPPVARVVRR
jgi:hypothetical protein